MTDTPLATVDQLAAYLQQPFLETDPAALLVLQIASAIIRDTVQQHFTAVTGDVVVLDPINGESVFLPELPVTAVTLVETLDDTVTPGVWSTVDPTLYTVTLATGQVSAQPFTSFTWPLESNFMWPSDPGTWRVTYSHGFTVIPDGLMGVCVSLAARIYVTEDGIDSERIGGYMVKYQSNADGFSPLQMKTLGRYMVPRVS